MHWVRIKSQTVELFCRNFTSIYFRFDILARRPDWLCISYSELNSKQKKRKTEDSKYPIVSSKITDQQIVWFLHELLFCQNYSQKQILSLILKHLTIIIAPNWKIQRISQNQYNFYPGWNINIINIKSNKDHATSFTHYCCSFVYFRL